MQKAWESGPRGCPEAGLSRREGCHGGAFSDEFGHGAQHSIGFWVFGFGLWVLGFGFLILGCGVMVTCGLGTLPRWVLRGCRESAVPAFARRGRERLRGRPHSFPPGFVKGFKEFI